MEELKYKIKTYYIKMFKKLAEMEIDDNLDNRNVRLHEYRSIVQKMVSYWDNMFSISDADNHYAYDDYNDEDVSGIIVDGLSLIYNYVGRQMILTDPILPSIVAIEIDTVIDKHQNTKNVKMAISKMKIQNINKDFS